MSTDGAIVTPLDRLETLVADCAAWQDWTGTSTASDAKDYIYIMASATLQYPYCVIHWPGGFNADPFASGEGYAWNREGQATLNFTEKLPDDLRGDEDLEAAARHVAVNVGLVVEDMMDLLGTGGYIGVKKISAPRGVQRPTKDQGRGQTAEGAWLRLPVQVQWGRV